MHAVPVWYIVPQGHRASVIVLYLLHFASAGAMHHRLTYVSKGLYCVLNIMYVMYITHQMTINPTINTS